MPNAQPIAAPTLTTPRPLAARVWLFLVAPVVVALTATLGYVLLTSFAIPRHPAELLAAAILNILGGTLAVVPLAFRLDRGAIAIAQAGLMGIAIRCATLLAGLILAFGPGWQLDRWPLVIWTLAFYFPLLIADTTLIALLTRRSKY